MQFLTEEEVEKRISNSYELPNNVLNAIPAPLVTVRTSTYQHGAYIKECIEGVLSQKTDFPFEFIIGEDFSTDGTREIVFEYAKKYPDIIRVMTADYNVGMKANGIRCINVSRGKYMALCEGDDYWTDPEKLQRQVNMLEAHPEYSMCFHNAKVVYEDRKTKSHPFTYFEKNIYTLEDVICKPWFTPTQSMVMRRDLVQKPRWHSFIFNGDFALQLLLAQNSPFCCIDEEMSVYRRNNGSLSANIRYYQNPLNKIQILHYFDMYAEFRYHDVIESRIREITDGLYKLYLYERPFWSKLLSVDYYGYKFSGLLQKISRYLPEYGYRNLPRLFDAIFRRRG